MEATVSGIIIATFSHSYYVEGFPNPVGRFLWFSHSEERVRSLVQDRDMKTSTLVQETEKFQKLSDNVIKLQVRTCSLGFLLEGGFCSFQPYTFIQRNVLEYKCFTSQIYKMEIFFHAGII